MKNRISRIIDNDLEAKKEKLIFSLMTAGIIFCTIGWLLCIGILFYMSK